jgi:hypothetical protein
MLPGALHWFRRRKNCDKRMIAELREGDRLETSQGHFTVVKPARDRTGVFVTWTPSAAHHKADDFKMALHREFGWCPKPLNHRELTDPNETNGDGELTLYVVSTTDKHILERYI